MHLQITINKKTLESDTKSTTKRAEKHPLDRTEMTESIPRIQLKELKSAQSVRLRAVEKAFKNLQIDKKEKKEKVKRKPCGLSTSYTQPHQG